MLKDRGCLTRSIQRDFVGRLGWTLRRSIIDRPTRPFARLLLLDHMQEETARQFVEAGPSSAAERAVPDHAKEHGLKVPAHRRERRFHPALGGEAVFAERKREGE